MIVGYIEAFVFTMLFEIPAFLVFYYNYPLDVALRSIMFNCLTLAFIWFGLPSLKAGLGYWEYFAVGFVFVVLVEALILKLSFMENSWARAFSASFVANGMSAVAGYYIGFGYGFGATT